MPDMRVDKAADYDKIAEYYDVFKRGRTEDHRFYVELAAECGNPVLEFCVGSGRVALVLAEHGHDVMGIDFSPGMLGCAKRHLASAPPDVQTRVRLIEGDMRSFWPADYSPPLVIVAYDSLFQLIDADDRRAFLHRVAENLPANGVLAADVSYCGAGSLSDWGERRPDGTVFFDGAWPEPFGPSGTLIRLRADRLDTTTGRSVRTVFCDHVSTSGAVRRVILRDHELYVPPEVLERELREAGFRTVEFFGGFDREPLFDPGLQGRGRQVFIARR